MADIAFSAFGNAFSERLAEIGYSQSRAAHQWPDTDKAMLSRACRGDRISAGNLLLLCRLAGLDPFAFLTVGKQSHITMKTILKQHVTVHVKRETAEPS